MNTVNANIRLGYQDSTWFTNNASFPLLSGQIVYCSDGADKGKYKIGDGTTQLSALTFYGGVATSYTANNGITLTGSNFKLGGDLTAATYIDGNYDLIFGDNTRLNNYQIYTDNNFVVNVDNGVNTNELELTPTTTSLSKTVLLNDGTASRILATDGSKNIQYLATTTYPSLTELSYVKGVTLALQTQLDNKLVAIMCQGSTGTVQFTASSTTYWSVMVVPASSLRSTVGQSLTSLPYNCTLVGAQITTWNASSSVSQTNSTLYFRLNGVDNTISSTVLWSASAATANVINVTNLNVAVTAGTTWELKLVMGALATAPTNAAQCNVILYFRI